MKRAVLSAAVPLLAIASAAGFSSTASANERDKKFFQQVEGQWAGPGEIVAGKYKGTKFNCSFAGNSADDKVGLTFDGGCRVGVFMQKMSATIEKGRTGYKGTFMDGAAGKGLNVTAGNVVGRKVILSLNRNQLNGSMQARLADDNTMTVTVSVKVDQQMVPVIGMNLKRVDGGSVGAIAQQ